MSMIRNIVFTLNNYTEEEEDQLKTHNDIKYIIYGKEEAPTTGTKHLQGYIQLKQRKRITTFKKKLGIERIHLEPARGTLEENQKYCSKGGDVYENGTATRKGQRSDLEYLVDEIKTKSCRQVIVDNPSAALIHLQNIQGLSLVLRAPDMSSFSVRTVYWLHGSTGVGKTKFAHLNSASEGSLLWVAPGGKLQWFDTLTPDHTSALLDDLRAEDVNFSFLLRLLDGYPLQVPIKGGFTWWNPSTVYITADTTPSNTFSARPRTEVDQLERRITHVIHVEMGKPIVIPE